MPRYLLGHKKLFVLLLVLLSAFLWMTYQVRSGDEHGLVKFSNYLLSPPQKVIRFFTSTVNGFWNHYIFLIGAAKENERLINEIGRMKTERNDYLDALEENKRLRSLLSLKETTANYVATVKVIGRNPSNWFKYVMVDKGETAGLKKDMAAITPAGLVGRVYRVMPGTARIILITDRNSSLAGKVLRTRDEGIIEGTGGNNCRLKYIPQSSELKIGDVVLSSGLDEIFPDGISIGTVTRVERKGPGLFQEVEVTPAADIARLEEILIVRSLSLKQARDR